MRSRALPTRCWQPPGRGGKKLVSRAVDSRWETQVQFPRHHDVELEPRQAPVPRAADRTRFA